MNAKHVTTAEEIYKSAIDAAVSKHFQLPGNVSGAYAVIAEVLLLERMRRMAEIVELLEERDALQAENERLRAELAKVGEA